jgi:hypothetical protein
MSSLASAPPGHVHRHVLAVCVLRYYFELPDSDGVVFEEDGYKVEEARKLGLKPLLACRLSFDGIGYSAVRVARLVDGIALGPMVQGVWERGCAEFKGPPNELLADGWLTEAVPGLAESLASVGCVVRPGVAGKKVSGAKGVLQRKRFCVAGRLTVASINSAEAWSERMWWEQLSVEAAGWRHCNSGATRSWPQGLTFPPCVLHETKRLFDTLPVKIRPQRDPHGDAQIERALRILAGNSEMQDGKVSLARISEGTSVLVETLRSSLDHWLEGLRWQKGSCLFVGTETGCGIARIRVGAPADRWAAVMNRPPTLPAVWPHLNEWTCEIDGFGLELQLWDLREGVDLTVAVVVEGCGRWWIKDALKAEGSQKIGQLLKRGNFKVEWEDLGGSRLKDSWSELTTTLADEKTVSGVCLERRLMHGIRADEVRKAMVEAREILDVLLDCSAKVWESRRVQGGK